MVMALGSRCGKQDLLQRPVDFPIQHLDFSISKHGVIDSPATRDEKACDLDVVLRERMCNRDAVQRSRRLPIAGDPRVLVGIRGRVGVRAFIEQLAHARKASAVTSHVQTERSVGIRHDVAMLSQLCPRTKTRPRRRMPKRSAALALALGSCVLPTRWECSRFFRAS